MKFNIEPYDIVYCTGVKLYRITLSLFYTKRFWRVFVPFGVTYFIFIFPCQFVCVHGFGTHHIFCVFLVQIVF